MQASEYYFPPPSHWPLKGAASIFVMLWGLANWLQSVWFGPYLFILGLFGLLYVAHGWFATVIQENRAGLLQSPKVGRSFRWGMCWFIFTEVMLFAAFFAALFYTRIIILPALGGESSISHIILWPEFKDTWPLLKNPNPASFVAPQSVMYTWGIPALNTLILLASGATVTMAYVSLLKNHRKRMLLCQAITILLGFSFLALQSLEYSDAYFRKGLTLASGMYGTTFFTLTGLHGLHVTIGSIGLCVIFYRMLKQDFGPNHYFASEAVSWYWHFVDVIWLLLFVFVYWL